MINKKIKQMGFTLVEVMVAGAILAGLSLAGLKLMDNQTRSTNIIAVQNEEERLIGLIHAVLSNEQSCTATFTGKFINTNAASFTHNPPAFTIPLNASTTATAILNSSSTGATIAMFEMKNPTLAATAGGVKKYGSKNLVILNYILEDEATGLNRSFGTNVQSLTQVKFANLRVYIERDHDADKDIAGSKTMLKKIPIVVTTETAGGANARKVVACRASGGLETSWTQNTGSTDLHYTKGMIAIGTSQPSAGGGNLQVYGGAKVEGTLMIKQTLQTEKLQVDKNLVLPTGNPQTPQNGMIWIKQ